MKNCPVCGKRDAVNAQAEGLWERAVLRLVGYRPYRCSFCRSRFRAFNFFNGAPASRISRKNGHAAENRRPVETFPEFLQPEDQKEFRELIEEIRQAEHKVQKRPEGHGVRGIEEIMSGERQPEAPERRANAVFGPGRVWNQKR